jgi:predicted dehydrogenase
MSSWTTEKDQEALTIGVVGCGYWGSKHARVLSSLDGVEVALIDSDDERREAIAKSYPPALSVRTIEEALPVSWAP